MIYPASHHLQCIWNLRCVGGLTLGLRLYSFRIRESRFGLHQIEHQDPLSLWSCLLSNTRWNLMMSVERCLWKSHSIVCPLFHYHFRHDAPLWKMAISCCWNHRIRSPRRRNQILIFETGYSYSLWLLFCWRVLGREEQVIRNTTRLLESSVG